MSTDILKRFVKQACISKQEDILETKVKPDNKRPNFVTQCNTINPDMNKLVRNH